MNVFLKHLSDMSKADVEYKCYMGWIQPGEIADELKGLEVETGSENLLAAAVWWLRHCTSTKNYLDIIHERDRLLMEVCGLECRLERLKKAAEENGG